MFSISLQCDGVCTVQVCANVSKSVNGDFATIDVKIMFRIFKINIIIFLMKKKRNPLFWGGGGERGGGCCCFSSPVWNL